MSGPAIDLAGVCKRYGSIMAVDDLTWQLPRGALCGLVGANGAGKSTTFAIMCGWLSPDSGTAQVLQTPCDALHRLRGRVAALPQDAAFSAQIDVKRQLCHLGRLMGLSARQAERETQRVLEAVGLQHVAAMRGSELSHGMHKRVGLAQALIGDPELIFLDEPTAGLDPAAARQVRDLLASLIPRCTVVFASHNLLQLERLCTHVAVMDHGRVVHSGTMDATVRSSATLSVTLQQGATPPRARLDERFGADAVKLTDNVLHISHASAGDAETIAEVLRLLLESGTHVLGVQRGSSLEDAFLQATRPSPPLR